MFIVGHDHLSLAIERPDIEVVSCVHASLILDRQHIIAGFQRQCAFDFDEPVLGLDVDVRQVLVRCPIRLLVGHLRHLFHVGYDIVLIVPRLEQNVQRIRIIYLNLDDFMSKSLFLSF